MPPQGSGTQHMHTQSTHNATRTEVARYRQWISKDRFTRSKDYPSGVTRTPAVMWPPSPPPHHIVVGRPRASRGLVVKRLIFFHLYSQAQKTRHLSVQEEHGHLKRKPEQIFSSNTVRLYNHFLFEKYLGKWSIAVMKLIDPFSLLLLA